MLQTEVTMRAGLAPLGVLFVRMNGNCFTHMNDTTQNEEIGELYDYLIFLYVCAYVITVIITVKCIS